MSKKNIVFIVVVLVVVLGAAFWMKKTNGGSSYSVVYLSTGEVYVGKLSQFPDFKLTNGYILQVTKDSTDPNKSNFQLNPISEALWAPQALHINRKNIVFYGPLMSTSKIAETLAGQKK